MPTQILALPQGADPDDLVTSANSDWTDGFAFTVAGSAAGLGTPGNVGAGTLTVGAVAPQAPLGACTVQIVETGGGLPARYEVRDPTGQVLGIGRVGVAIAAGGLTLSLTQTAGQAAFAVGDSYVVGVLPAFLDLTGIAFDLWLRQAADPLPATVALRASTGDGTLVNGLASGVVSLAVPAAAMARLPVGTYAYDLLARADGRRIRVRFGTVTHGLGVTTPAA